MVREAKLPFDERSHPELFDEFPGFHATWEEEAENLDDELDSSVSHKNQNSAHHSCNQSKHAEDVDPKQPCQRAQSSHRGLADADWMNNPKDS